VKTGEQVRNRHGRVGIGALGIVAWLISGLSGGNVTVQGFKGVG
jgi:hypothetical protein